MYLGNLARWKMHALTGGYPEWDTCEQDRFHRMALATYPQGGSADLLGKTACEAFGENWEAIPVKRKAAFMAVAAIVSETPVVRNDCGGKPETSVRFV